MTRKVYVETWGCQMNVADSERLLGLLATQGFSMTKAPEDADLILLNTCNIREKARHKFASRLGILRSLKAARSELRIAVAGCVAQAEGEALVKEVPEIDVVVGPGRTNELCGLLEERARSGRSVVALGFGDGGAGEAGVPGGAHAHGGDHDHDHVDVHGDVDDGLELRAAPTISGKREVTRFVNVMHGCNNHCTFCVVPKTRGPEKSRRLDEVVAEVEAFARDGAKEITLLGQNVNSYGLDWSPETRGGASDGRLFVQLLRRVAVVPGVDRVRFTTSNPHDFSEGIARLFAEEPKLGRYLHLPLQSGNDRILGLMKRRLTAAEYLAKVGWLRAIDPEFALSTDIIVGFPGETEEEFEDTLRVVESVRFGFVYAFKYSARPGTESLNFPDPVDEGVKDRRLARLNALQDRITTQIHEAEIGRSRDVLFLYESSKERGVYYGKTPQFRLVRVAAGRDLVGLTLPVRILKGNKTALAGELV